MMKLFATLCSALGHACQMCSLENACVSPSAPALCAPGRSGMAVSMGTWGCAGQACGEPASSCLLADLAGVSKSDTKYPSCSSYQVQEGVLVLCHGVCPTVVHRVWATLPLLPLRKAGIHEAHATSHHLPWGFSHEEGSRAA